MAWRGGAQMPRKMLLVVRREEDKIRRAPGTGNYHTGTSRFYTDFSLLTSIHR